MGPFDEDGPPPPSSHWEEAWTELVRRPRSGEDYMSLLRLLVNGVVIVLLLAIGVIVIGLAIMLVVGISNLFW